MREDLRARHYKRHEDRGDQYLVSLETPLHENGPQESLPPKKERGRPKGSGKVKNNLLYEMHKALDENRSVDDEQDETPEEPEIKTPLIENGLPDLDVPNLLEASIFTTPDISSNISPELIAPPGGSATEIISWLFSDTMLANVRDPLLSPSYYSFDSPMALQNLLAPPTFRDEPGIGNVKRKQMMDFIPGIKADLAFNGLDEDLPFQKRYLASYWAEFHAQFPILHKPTFCADKCPSGLLWIIIAIGAAFLKEHLLAKSIASPLRWALFQSADFNPPSKLWIIQALLLLEVYEKAMGDRQMHIRAHIHHGTTLQLIRRGTILTGVTNEFNRTGSFLGSDGDDYLSCDNGDPWKRWIQSEATKRAALMAFVIDAYHCSLFGHPSFISIHEIRLSLPCSQSLWDSFPTDNGQGYDYRKIPHAITLPVIEALKLTLNKKRVETSPFGRKVLISGLMSIAGQMQQRDIQLDSFGFFNNGPGAGTLPASNAGWKEYLKSSYEFLASDYNKMLQVPGYFDYYAHPSATSTRRKELLSPFDPHRASSTEEIFLNRLIISGCPDPFYHLAHINIQVSILDLYIYAGAPFMFSQCFRNVDFDRTSRNIMAWVNNPQGINAVKHAILFLEEMYCPTGDTDLCPNPYSASDVIPGKYIASTDPVVHRPHAVFVCTLVVWSYCFALGGPESDALFVENASKEYTPTLFGEDMRKASSPPSTNSFPAAVAAANAMERMAHIPPKKPALEYISWLSRILSAPPSSSSPSLTSTETNLALEGSNDMSGLLRLIISSLEDKTWMLIEEDARLLTHCLERTLGKSAPKCHYHI